jgi:hypothetical protein
MSFNVVPFGGRPPANGEVTAEAAPGSGDAEIVDLADRREPAGDVLEIPEHVWREVDTASQRWHDLRAENREVRFDSDSATGRPVASLRDLRGAVVRPLPLRVVFGLDDDGPSSAA